MVFVAGVACAVVAVVAPFIGLGENDGFVLYRAFGVTRGQFFEAALWAAAVGATGAAATYRDGRIAGAIGGRIGRWMNRARAFVGDRYARLGRRGRAVFWLAAVAALAAVLATAEGIARYRAYAAYVADPRHYVTIFYSENIHPSPVDSVRGIDHRDSPVGLFKADRTITLAYLGKGGEVIRKADFRLNNVGLFSQNDYAVERGESEFRIVVLGNEQTAPTTAARPWPDVLNELLAGDGEFAALTGGRTPVVVNFGWPDAGFLHYPQVWEKARKFKPDLLLINIAGHDFVRAPNPPPPGESARKVDAAPTLIDFSGRIGAASKAIMVADCLAGPVDLRNPRCRIGRPHMIFADRDVFLDRDVAARLLDAVVGDFASGAVLRSRQSILLRRLLGRSLDPEAIRRDHWPPGAASRQPTPAVPKTRDDQLAAAAGVIEALRRDAPYILITRNVWYSEFFRDDDPFAMTRALKRRLAGVDVVLMAERMPKAGRDEIRSWYNVPYDDVKWSDKGHRVYAAAIAGAVKDYVRAHPEVVGSGERPASK